MVGSFKTIRVKMKGGKSRLQRVKVLASGKYRFVKNLVKSRATSPRHRSKTKSRSVRHTTRRKKNRGSRQGLVQGVENIAKVTALVAPTVLDVMASSTKASTFVYRVSGFSGGQYGDNKWHPEALVQTYGPFVAFTLLAKVYHKINGLLRRV